MLEFKVKTMVLIVLNAICGLACTPDGRDENSAVGLIASDYSSLSYMVTLPAREFNSSLELSVYAIGIDCLSLPKYVGKTPSEEPLVIPESSIWYVCPNFDLSNNIAAFILEMNSQKIPGVMMPSNTEAFHMEALVECRHLQFLNLRKTSLKLGALAHLKKMKGLTYIILPPQMTDDGLECLESLDELKCLRLTQAKITDAGLKHLARLTELRELSLMESEVNETGFRVLEKLNKLTVLWLDRSNVNDAGLKNMAGLKQLRILSLSETKITDDGVKGVVNLGNLQFLDLDFTEITDIGVARIGQMKEIQRLGLMGNHISDTGVKHISNLKKLQWLDISSYDKEIIGLVPNNKITDQGVAYIKNIATLRKLYLAGTAVTDVGLDYLATLPLLEELNISGTKISAVGITKFRKAAPRVEIICGEPN